MACSSCAVTNTTDGTSRSLRCKRSTSSRPDNSGMLMSRSSTSYERRSSLWRASTASSAVSATSMSFRSARMLTSAVLARGSSSTIRTRIACAFSFGVLQGYFLMLRRAVSINDLGQVVGISGDCFIAVGNSSARHAVLWQNGVPIDLGNIGGDAWNTPTMINNQGTIIGFANTLPGLARTFHAFIWTPADGMKDLGTLPGVCGTNACNDFRSEALGINEKGQIVGLSRGNPPPDGNAPFLFRAFVWALVLSPGSGGSSSMVPSGCQIAAL